MLTLVTKRYKIKITPNDRQSSGLQSLVDGYKYAWEQMMQFADSFVANETKVISLRDFERCGSSVWSGIKRNSARQSDIAIPDHSIEVIAKDAYKAFRKYLKGIIPYPDINFLEKIGVAVPFDENFYFIDADTIHIKWIGDMSCESTVCVSVRDLGQINHFRLLQENNQWFIAFDMTTNVIKEFEDETAQQFLWAWKGGVLN